MPFSISPGQVGLKRNRSSEIENVQMSAKYIRGYPMGKYEVFIRQQWYSVLETMVYEYLALTTGLLP